MGSRRAKGKVILSTTFSPMMLAPGVSRETWLKLRRMVETGKIRGMIDGVTKAVEEFVKRNEAKGD